MRAMDVLFLVEVVLEIFGELLFEAGLEGAGRVLRNRWLRYAVGAALGLVFGILWGRQLSGGQTWPKLLWVSLVLAAVAAVAAVARARAVGDRATSGAESGAVLADRPVGHGGWRNVLVPPWRWAVHRLVGFAVLNLALAFGIATSFTPAG
jgi:hypothetical protein